jgi:F0F1-type ATP synthase epsilon subunit
VLIVRKKYEGLLSVILPAHEGEIEILPNHAVCFIRPAPGEIILKPGKRLSIRKRFPF